jgi:hypothetical protein
VIEPNRELGRVRPGGFCGAYDDSLGECDWGLRLGGT